MTLASKEAVRFLQGEIPAEFYDQYLPGNVQVLFAGNDMVVKIVGLKDETLGTFVNNATVTCRVKDSDGVELAGITFPVTLGYEPGSDGNYSGVLEAALAVAIGDKVMVEIAVDAGVAGVGLWQMLALVQRRS